MRTSKFFISTLKEAPAEAEVISHKLMLRAGLIKRLAAGIYTWMPLGLRVLRKVETIIRNEMNKAGAIELLMPAVQPGELWQESGRWQQYGPELLRLKDRHQRDFCIGPTHEEVITDVVRREVKSYRQLPLHFYQIQTKFRDEIRPRFGVMRGREFIMKDAYSFHANYPDLQREYQNMFETYSRIFTRLGLKFRAVAADTGSIGGTGSHEFHVLAASGEDAIAFCPSSDYAANVELAEALPSITKRNVVKESMQKIATPGKTRCEDVASFLNVPLEKMVKTIAVMHNDIFCLLLLRGDHELNEVKVTKIPDLNPFRFANEEEIIHHLGCRAGYIGPVKLPNPNIPVIADRSVAVLTDFVCGANEAGFHLKGVNFGIDLREPIIISDIRKAVEGDPSPDGKGKLSICRGIEVGHIFQLRTKYSQTMQTTFLDETGQERIIEMGCYGIGVTRIVGAAIEQNYDEKGIIFPEAMAPFQVAIIPIGMNKSLLVKETTEKLYAELLSLGADVLLDDRDERAGSMFADAELMGIPHRLTVGERGLKENMVEYQGRRDSISQKITLSECTRFLQSKLFKA